MEKVVFLKKIESSHISGGRKKHLRNPTGIELYFSDWKTEHRGKSCQKNIPNDAFQTATLNLPKNRFQIIFLLFLFSLSKLKNLRKSPFKSQSDFVLCFLKYILSQSGVSSFDSFLMKKRFCCLKRD